MELVSGPQLDNYPLVAGYSRQTLFDPEIELLWSSTVGGQLASYRCTDLSRYSSIQVCYPDGSVSSQLGLIRDFTISSHSVFTATYRGLRTYSKGCLLRDDGHQHPSLQSSMRCVVMNPFHQLQVFCANDNGQGMLVDCQRFKIIRQENMSSNADCCITSCSWTTQALVTGDSKGKLSIREPASFRELLATCAFVGPIFDISTSEYQIAVAGMSSLTTPQIMDTNVKIFDIRKLYPLQTIFTGGVPLEIKLDVYGTTLGYSDKLLWILNNLGVLECFNISDEPGSLINSIVYDDTMNTFITSFDISEMGPIALADSIGMFHIWSYNEQDIEGESHSFSIHCNPTYPKEPTLPALTKPRKINVSDIEVAMLKSSFEPGDIIDQELETDWLSSLVGHHYNEYVDSFVRWNRFRRVDPKVLTQVHKIGKFSYIPIPSSYEHNSSYGWIEYIPNSNTNKSTNQLSEQFRDNPAYRCVYTPIDLVALQSFEGFDYSLYNKSPFCGLENGLSNSYVNSVIQSLFFLEEFREYVTPLYRIRIEQEYCLMDELSLLFQMMKVGSGEACEASNFMRAFQKIPNTTALGLLDGPTAHPVALRVENFIRYMLEQLCRDEETSEWNSLEEDEQTLLARENQSPAEQPKVSIVECLFGNRVLETFQFAKSFSHSERTHFLWTLRYENLNSATNRHKQPYSHLLEDFPQRLEASFCEETRNIRAYNEISKTFESCNRCKYLIEPSDVLLIGCNFADEENYLNYWFRYCGEMESNEERWSDEPFRARAANRALLYGQDIPCQLFFETTNDMARHNNIQLPNWKVKSWSCSDAPQQDSEKIYDLYFVIAFVPSEPIYSATPSKAWSDFPPAGHLVLYVQAPKEQASKEAMDNSSSWWCINDFCITRCQSISEVTRFHPNWKLPGVLGYKCRNSSKSLPMMETTSSLAEIYQRACSVVINPMPERFMLNTGRNDLFPPKGAYIALDAEFVEISKQVAEIHGDGSCRILKPAQMSLGRVSVIFSSKNSSDSNFVVLMDDYIVQREHVVDYLTKYSGLTFEDLNPTTSRYPLTTLKAVYMKLRCLVDNGCILIGHGLKKDFRIINFIVPKSQVIDTVELYRLPRQRLLSLRFLAATLLHENIQGASHDSVEDAQTAWRLFFYYQKLEEKGLVSQLLEDLYKYGREHHWQYSSEHPFVAPTL